MNEENRCCTCAEFHCEKCGHREKLHSLRDGGCVYGDSEGPCVCGKFVGQERYKDSKFKDKFDPRDVAILGGDPSL